MIKPLISEKSVAKTAEGKYTFILGEEMSKVAVSKLVAKYFNVTPISVNTMTRKGKVKRTGRIMGQRKDTAIAIVTLKKGDKINGFDFPVEEKETPKVTTKVTKEKKTPVEKKEVAKKEAK